MPSVTKAQIEQARTVDLLAYLQTYEPGVLIPKGNGMYRHREHDSLVYFQNYWYWNSRGRAINALDYLTEIRGYGFVDAVNKLIGESRSLPSVSSASTVGRRPISTQKKNTKPFQLPWVRRCATYMLSYLQRRGIHYDVVSRCLQCGILYESQYQGQAVCVFVGRDDTGKERFACVRSIVGNLKKDISGSDKRFSFCYPPDQPQPGIRLLAVFEAPIDALSHATLQKLNGWKWNGYRLSLGGTSAVALISFLERHPEITRIALYLDNDRAGLTNAHKIKALLQSDSRFSKIKISINPPRQGKDYNEKLLDTIQKNHEKNLVCRQEKAALSM